MTKLKRCVSILLVLSLLLAGVVYQAPEASAYMAALPLPELTGNTAQDVANIAISQLGYHEVGGGTVYGAWWSGVTQWGDYTYLGWCSMFANWCAYQAGAGMNIAYNKYSAIVGNSYSYLKNNAWADRSFDTPPQPGDFIYFGRGDSFEHVAVVVGYDSATNKVTFVGGNQGDAVTQGIVEWSASAKWGSQYVLGYGRPNYGGSVTAPTCSCDTYYAGYYECTTSGSPLNIRSGHSTSSAVVGSIPKGAAVYVSKAQGTGDGAWAHVEYNGVSGYASMQYLSRMEDHTIDIRYADNGDVTGVEITVFDYVEAAGYALTLQDRIDASDRENAVPISISIPDAFRLELTVPCETANNGNIFVAEYSDGTVKTLTETVVSGRYISIAVEGNVTLYVVNGALEFPDVPSDFWARDEIDYLTARSLMSGKQDGTFAPTETITRRTVAMMLWRLAGSPEVEGECPFTDVAKDRYYTAILWAYQSGIISGYADHTFRPDTVISRQHFAAMLHRYALFRGVLLPAVTDTQLSDFADADKVYSWAQESCQWSLSCGVIYGRSGGVYDPQGSTSRAQMAVILFRFLQACNQSQNID